MFHDGVLTSTVSLGRRLLSPVESSALTTGETTFQELANKTGQW